MTQAEQQGKSEAGTLVRQEKAFGTRATMQTSRPDVPVFGRRPARSAATPHFFTRQPSPEEEQILARRLAALRAQYAGDPAAAAALLQVGESKRDEALDPIDHAAYQGVCLLLLNLDETLNK